MATNTTKQSYLNKSRKDKFILVFQLPPALKEVQDRSNRSSFKVSQDAFQMSVYGSIVPELEVPAIQIPYVGNNLYHSSHAREPYPPTTVNFTVDNEFNNYWTIYKWLDLMHDEKIGLYDADKLVDQDFAYYQTNMSIYGMDEYDNKRIEFVYTKAFPVTLGGIDYSYRDEGELESSMTFVYSQLHTKLIDF